MSEYFVDGEAVLPNRLGIDNPDELRIAEEEIVSARMAELSKNPIYGDL